MNRPALSEEMYLDQRKIQIKELEAKPIVLYEDSVGSKEDITLIDSVKNYSRIIIYYKNPNFNLHDSTEIIEPNGKKASLKTGMVYSNNNAYYTYYYDILINDKTITRVNGGYYAVYPTGSIEYSYGGKQIAIYKVVGYK